MPLEILVKSLIAGLLASLACGLGALPLLLKHFDLQKHTGLGYGFAGGLMLAASVYNLILPGLQMAQSEMSLSRVAPVLAGILLGSVFLWSSNRYLSEERLSQASWKRWGGRTEILIFLAMSIHSIPEGVAVGVGYASEELYSTHLGSYIALAIGNSQYSRRPGRGIAHARCGRKHYALFLGCGAHEPAATDRGAAGRYGLLVFSATDARAHGVRCRRHDVSHTA